jgi:hypothetical protein
MTVDKPTPGANRFGGGLAWIQRSLLLVSAVVGFWMGEAQAASRLVISIEGNSRVYVDGVIVVPAGGTGRAVLNALPTGSHLVEVRSSSGQLLSSTKIEAPADGQVDLKVGAGGQVTVMGASSRPASGGPPPGATPPPGGGNRPPPPAPSQPASAGGSGAYPPASSASSSTPSGNGGVGGSVAGAATVQSDPNAVDDTSSFDYNEGGGRRSGGSGNGNRDWQAAAGAVGRVASSGVAPGIGGPVVGVVAPAVGGAAVNLVRNAEAGGLDDLRRGGGGGTQGRPLPPAAPTGTVAFQSPTETVVYLEGFQIARTGAANPKAQTRLEQGRHTLEFRDPVDSRILWRGVVEVHRDQLITIVWDENTPPSSPDKSWAWSNR